MLEDRPFFEFYFSQIHREFSSALSSGYLNFRTYLENVQRRTRDPESLNLNRHPLSTFLYTA